MADISRSYKTVSTLKLTLIVVITVSIVFPILFAYINDELTANILTRELTFTPLRLAGITMIVYVIIRLVNKVGVNFKAAWLPYIIELPAILFISFWWLIFFLQ